MVNEYSKEEKEIDRQLRKYGNVQNLMQYINYNTLYEKHLIQDKNKATGVDKMTKKEYSRNIETNISSLIQRMKENKYYVQPVRRTYIPKVNGKLRPLGIPAYEDKLVQAQVSEILNIIFERYFKDFSYGFRPNKDCHQAINRIDKTIMNNKVNYIVEADIKGFFDNVDHNILIRLLEVIIKDKNFIKLIKKFLKSGYMYEDKIEETDKGTPQGGIISPILANLYLHVALDNWFENNFKQICKGKAYLVRYADDFVAMFEKETDAKLFYEMLVNRLAQFKLEIEPTKTRIFPFGRNNKNKESFDFLGFTISDSITRNGNYRVDYTTAKKKSKLKFQMILEYVKQNRTAKPKDLIKAINRKLTGLYNYYGISGNYDWLMSIYLFVVKIIKKWLSRRSQKGIITWNKMLRIIEYNPIVKPSIKYSLW